MTGSIKDRMALHIVAQGYAKGLLKQGDLIAEATSGNTGISFSAIGRALGHPATASGRAASMSPRGTDGTPRDAR